MISNSYEQVFQVFPSLTIIFLLQIVQEGMVRNQFPLLALFSNHPALRPPTTTVARPSIKTLARPATRTVARPPSRPVARPASRIMKELNRNLSIRLMDMLKNWSPGNHIFLTLKLYINIILIIYHFESTECTNKLIS